MKKISIIVPVYNVEKYLCKCIESILCQELIDFELILINDGSTDKSGEICEKYKFIDNRIKVIHKVNGGLSSARNTGLEIAEGEYIGFVDSDDWVDLSMYKKLYNAAILNNADIAQCSINKVYNEDNIKEQCMKKDIKIMSKNEALENLLDYRKSYIECVVTWNKLYKSHLFKRVRFPEGKIHEDEFTTYKVFDQANKVVRLNEELYFYRQTPNSIMNSKFELSRLNYLEALQEQLTYFSEHKNKQLYTYVLANYDSALRNTYLNVKKYLNDIELLEDIKSMQKHTCKLVIKSKDINYRKKILSIIFSINSNIYEIIHLLKKKI